MTKNGDLYIFEFPETVEPPTMIHVILCMGIALINEGIYNGIYDEATKNTAKFHIDEGFDKSIPMQILANGNLDQPDDVLQEFQLHAKALYEKQQGVQS